MTNELKLDKPAKNYSFNVVDHAWVFPRVGTAVKLDQVRDELISFEGILGAIIRHNAGCDSHPPTTDNLFDQCLSHALKHVNTNCENELASILRDLYFEPGTSKLKRFSLGSLSYLEPGSDVPKNSFASIISLGEFFSCVFMPPGPIAQGASNNKHLLDQIMLNSLPKLEPNKRDSEPRILRKFEDELVGEFQKDLEVLLKNESLFLSHIGALARFYLFQYLTELIRYLNRSIESLRSGNPIGPASVQGLHFLIEGERASASRVGVAEGWRSVKDSFVKVFSHINCLELLNHIELPGEGPLDYLALANLSSRANLDAIRKLASSFVEVAVAPGNTKVKFAHGEQLLSDIGKAASCADAVFQIWYWIDYEINHSGRGRVINDIAKWFCGFGQGTLLQQRGPLGNVTVLPLSYLHLLVTVIVKSSGQERIRLKELWDNLARRGILLDEGSKRAVILNLEEIGALESKSDSGDAKYVRSPF
jgi:DNA phosphorothioation-dependent restriction protein DptG